MSPTQELAVLVGGSSVLRPIGFFLSQLWSQQSLHGELVVLSLHCSTATSCSMPRASSLASTLPSQLPQQALLPPLNPRQHLCQKPSIWVIEVKRSRKLQRRFAMFVWHQRIELEVL